uniref:Uncharacterized protein n=1 Tax=Siphoviridae sp. cttqT1 TaxID=2827961 RepID=A0A8S5TP07_9CAUD|nr:MAG TPA: hypothetical protein [Siphoviridae sp. cttqT1]
MSNFCGSLHSRNYPRVVISIVGFKRAPASPTN